MNRLTDAQERVYSFICRYIQEHGKSPLLPEIARGIGIKSIGSLHKQVQALVEHGFIEIIPHRHRGIRLLDHPELHSAQQEYQAIASKAINALQNPQGADLSAIVKSLASVQQQLTHVLHHTPAPANHCTLPLLGKIAAGRPIEAIPNEQELDLTTVFSGNRLYALHVQGDSMIDEGILDGDKVVCEQASVANNGDIVVALIDQENATLKKLQRNNDGTITLIPANASMTPMTYAAERVQIQGKLLGVVRVARQRK